MKKLLVLVLVFLIGASLSFAKETGSSHIKEVTLFSNQALVKREATVKLHKGLNEILIDLQAFRVERDSVSAKVFGEGEIYIYKVDVPLHLENVNLTMFSRINQKTGEDWNKISLSLSNVIPLKGVGLPSPRSWILDIPRARQKVARRSRRKPAARVLKEKLDAAADKGGAKFVQAQKKELPLSFEYSMPQALTIESRDKDTFLPIFSKTLTGEFVYFSVPKISPLTFLVCRTNADKELLSGPLHVHFGGRFIGKTSLTEKKPGEAFKMSLGADREVKVKREKVKDKVKETYFGKIERKTVVRDMAFKITVENIKEKPIKLKVLDSIPVSRTDRIEVKDLKITPVPAEENYQDQEGVLLWELRLKPGDKQEITMEFVVTYPKDTPVFGL